MEANNASAMYDALNRIAHYCDNPDGMDDPYCADGHVLSDIAKRLFLNRLGIATCLAATPRGCTTNGGSGLAGARIATLTAR